MSQKYDSFESMSKPCEVFEESEVPYFNPPMINQYEKNLPGSDGIDYSGFVVSKKSNQGESRMATRKSAKSSKGKMSDRRGYEKDDLKKASKAVTKRGGKAAFEKAMKEERKDYRKDVKAYKKKK